VTGERKNVKILGAIELWRTRFDYRQDTVFNATTYLGFLEQLARRYRRQGAILIQDNASYHKDAEVWAWFKVQPALAGSAPVAALLAGIESYRTAVAAHPQERNAQPFLRRPGRTTRYPDARLRGDAVAPPTDPVLSDFFLLIAMSL